MDSYSRENTFDQPLNLKSSERMVPSSSELLLSERRGKENKVLPSGVIKIDKSR